MPNHSVSIKAKQPQSIECAFLHNCYIYHIYLLHGEIYWSGKNADILELTT